MNLFSEAFLEKRIGQIRKDLLEKDIDYALTKHKYETLADQVDPILFGDTDLEITGGDRMNLNEFYELIELKSFLENLALYRQGYMDCIKVLKSLGVL